MAPSGLDIRSHHGWFSALGPAAFASTLIRARAGGSATNAAHARAASPPACSTCAPSTAARGRAPHRHPARMNEPPLLIGTAHHDNHAWFSFAASPFAREAAPTIVAVLDGLGDGSSISLYLCARRRACASSTRNDSVFDSLGLFYSFISSTQGGWTLLSSEGRYMGATAYGDNDRLTNPYYAALKTSSACSADGRVYLNRDLANWPRNIVHEPYTDGADPHSRRADPGREDVEPGRDAAHRGHPARPRSRKQRLDKAAACADGVRGCHLPHRRSFHPRRPAASGWC